MKDSSDYQRYLEDILKIRECLLATDFFDLSHDSFKDSLSNLEWLTSDYLAVALELQAAGLAETKYVREHIFVDNAVHNEMLRSKTFESSILNRSNILQEAKGNAASEARDLQDEVNKVIRVEFGRYPALTFWDQFFKEFVLPNYWNGNVSEFDENINDSWFDGYTVIFQNTSMVPKNILHELKPFIQCCTKRSGWTVQSDIELSELL